MKKYVIKNKDGSKQAVMSAIYNTRREALLTILDYITDDSQIEDYIVEEVDMKDVNEVIMDYEDALKSIGPTRFCHVRTTEQNAKVLIALNKLFTIAAAWNKLDDFVPDFSNEKQIKWIPMFSYCSDACTFTTRMPITLNKNVCTRLCFKTCMAVWNSVLRFIQSSVFVMRYKITDETLKMGDLILHRIEATESFSVGDYLVIPGDKGGWIEKESNLQENAWVDGEGMVYGDAVVTGNARVFENGTIRDNAKVYGNAIVRGYSKVMDNACICQNAQIFGYAVIRNDAMISGNAKVINCAEVSNSAHVCDYALISSNAKISDSAIVRGNAKVRGQAKVRGYAEVSGDAIVHSQVIIGDHAIVTDSAKIGQNCTIMDYAFIGGSAELENVTVKGFVKFDLPVTIDRFVTLSDSNNFVGFTSHGETYVYVKSTKEWFPAPPSIIKNVTAL